MSEEIKHKMLDAGGDLKKRIHTSGKSEQHLIINPLISAETEQRRPTQFNVIQQSSSYLLNNIDSQNNNDIGFDQFNLKTRTEPEKFHEMEEFLESAIGEQSRNLIIQLVEQISQLKQQEKLLLYLKLPCTTNEIDPLRQPQNPLGTRSEINQTINWVRSHLEHDPEVSIPKQDVYNDYISYCERLSIKPLSTADFGKVMKQVFPEIRPRRLGTRGHSRYCYAAMRKTTKLPPPSLPTIGKASVTEQTDELINQCLDDDCWKLIKVWAEGLLSTSFKNIRDLSTHIQRNQLNTPASNSSRYLLQKKILQKECKEKKKFGESGPLKKRRKRRRKNSSSSESAQDNEYEHEANQSVQKFPVSVKEEIFDNVRISNYDVVDQQVIPINLAPSVSNELSKNVDNIPTVNNDIVEKVENNQISSMSIIKEEVKTDDYNNVPVFCKKVRQAQQAKGLWMGRINTVPATASNAINQQQSVITSNFTNFNNINLRASNVNDLNSSNETSKLNSIGSLELGAKKIRYLQEKSTGQIDDGVSPEKDASLPENLGLPRERVISICNMDKKELDDYLNVIEETDDQDPELMQYFHPEESDTKTSNKNISFVNKIANKAEIHNVDSNDQINQLRLYLHQSLAENGRKSIAQLNANSISDNNSHENLNNGIVAVSPSFLANSIHDHNRKTSTTISSIKQKSNSNISFETREKRNCSFIPIVPNTELDQDSFVCPSVFKKRAIQGNKISSVEGSTDQFCPPNFRRNFQGVSKTGTRNNSSNSDIRFSTSADTLPQTTSNEGIVLNGEINMSQNFTIFDSHNLKQSLQSMCGETRSQSVPLHYRNNSNSPTLSNVNLNDYPSACNSLTQTPAPQDFNDFNTETTSNIFQMLHEDPDSNFVSSKSVPSTPLINSFKHGSYPKQIPENISERTVFSAKSVPSTPKPHRNMGSNVFRYSPDFGNRDSLISGISYCEKDSMESMRSSSIATDIEELQTFDSIDNDMF